MDCFVVFTHSSQSDVSPGNCCKIARIDRISSLFNDDGDSRLWM
ncbi:hypothetical protein [Candidatus Tisiphia endosymbiont of Sialis lutaria]